jgi:hypothetical protein
MLVSTASLESHLVIEFLPCTQIVGRRGGLPVR